MRQAIIRGLFLLMGVLLSAVVAGCATPGTGDNDSELPWNTPQPWEGAPLFPGFNEQ